MPLNPPTSIDRRGLTPKVNFDGTYASEYPNGDKPEPSVDITDLAVTSKTATSVTLGWTGIDEVTALERALTPGSFTEVQAGISANATEVTDSELTESTEYQYRLTFASGTSNTVSVTTNAAGAFSPLVQDDIESRTLTTVYPDWASNSTIDDTRAKSGTKSIKVALDQGGPPATCGGDKSFGGRRTLPEVITEGHSLWLRMFFYIPSSMSAGYIYGTDDEGVLSAGASGGATSITIDESSFRGDTTFNIGDHIAIELDDASYQSTTISSVSLPTIGLSDALSGPATSGNVVDVRDKAEARACGFGAGAADGSNRMKWLVFAQNSSSARMYFQLHGGGRRATAGFNGMNMRSEVNNDLTFFNSQAIPTDQWTAFQLQIYAHSDPLQGFMRAWIDDTYIGQNDGATLSDPSYGIAEWGLGNIWNGVPYTDGDVGTTGDFWVDELMVATDSEGYGGAPDVDAGGRPYIATTTLAGA